MVDILHLAHSEAGTVGGGLHEQREPELLDDVFLVKLILVSVSDKDAVCHRDAESPEVIVQGELVECERLNEHSACRVRYLEQVKISLQLSVLARSAVYSDIDVVKMVSDTVLNEREVVAVDTGREAIVKVHMPVETSHLDYIDIISLLVEE